MRQKFSYPEELKTGHQEIGYIRHLTKEKKTTQKGFVSLYRSVDSGLL